MKINSFDHIVITVRNLDETIAFYTKVLGMKEITFSAGRKALAFGAQKINLHKTVDDISPRAQNPLPGSADLCFVTDTPMEQVMAHFLSCGVTPVKGPTTKTGAISSLLSAYIYDPDGNLIEIANRIED